MAPIAAGGRLEVMSFESAGRRITFAPMICFDAIFPEINAAFAAQDPDLLLNPTNDAWYGYSSAPYQHFEQAALRAVEEGRYLVRSANTGVSAVVDPYGRVVAQSSLFRPAVLVAQVRTLEGLTLYARVGDLVAYLALLVTLVALGAAVTTARSPDPCSPCPVYSFPMALVLDELTRRYQDLVRRSIELRGYL
jgi:apolipoprotein N-acyltransferase